MAKNKMTQYITRDTRNLLMSGGYDVEAYHNPSPDNPTISELVLMLMGAIDVPDHFSDSIPIEIKIDEQEETSK